MTIPMILLRTFLTLIFVAILPTAGWIHSASAKSYDDEEVAALLKVLSNSKLTLVQGVRQAAKEGEAPISAKFELDDNKKLSLSVYTAGKGLSVDPEGNVLKELSGSPEQAAWTPETEVFKDLPHVARASGHLTLMAVTKHSLASLIATVQKGTKGTVFSAIPAVEHGHGVLIVLVSSKGHVKEVRVHLRDGKIQGTK